jgi:hypothetical protein
VGEKLALTAMRREDEGKAHNGEARGGGRGQRSAGAGEERSQESDAMAIEVAGEEKVLSSSRSQIALGS